MRAPVNVLSRIKRLARPGRTDRRFRSALFHVHQRTVSLAWHTYTRPMMLATAEIIETDDPQADAWHAARSTPHAVLGVTFLGDNTCVVTVNEPEAPRFLRFVRPVDRRYMHSF